jgi:hypothetical protein
MPDSQQSFELFLADQALGVSPIQQASWVGRPDPIVSMTFQPLSQDSERLVTGRR